MFPATGLCSVFNLDRPDARLQVIKIIKNNGRCFVQWPGHNRRSPIGELNILSSSSVGRPATKANLLTDPFDTRLNNINSKEKSGISVIFCLPYYLILPVNLILFCWPFFYSCCSRSLLVFVLSRVFDYSNIG